MKNCKNSPGQLSFVFTNRNFDIDPEKLSEVLKKLNMPETTFTTAIELKNFLKRNHLLIEEFLEFISF